MIDMKGTMKEIRKNITGTVEGSTLTIRPKGPITIRRAKNADEIIAKSKRTHGGTWWIAYQREKGNIDPERADRIIKYLRHKRKLRRRKR